MKLNLGCSTDVKGEGFVNVDKHPGPGVDVVADLSLRWPWEDNSIDVIYAKDVFEHIDNAEFPGNKGKIWVLNEAHRVLKHRGWLEFFVPCVMLSDGRVNPGAFCDPTHVSFWTEDDRYYFCTEWNDPITGERGRLGPAYGVTALFDLDHWTARDYGEGRERRSKLHALLSAVKR